MILKEKPWTWRIPFLILLIIGTIYAIRRDHTQPETNSNWKRDQGAVFGTFYHAIYESDADLKAEMEEALNKVDASLSMFNPKSAVSRINQNESNKTDSLLEVVFALAQTVSQKTDGCFDVTVAPLVNAWGLGYKNGARPDAAAVDSLKDLIGWQRISIANHMVKKDDKRMVMDFSAIAKGFGCDVVANVFRTHGVKNFMIEIGGEVVVEGINDKGGLWRVGVNKPEEDQSLDDEEMQEVLKMTNQAMATSGNYRNYYTTKDGQRIAHTIDPHTGYPVQHSILSATVFAPSCAEADAFATSFMVMGLQKAQEVLKHEPQLKAYIIYNENGNNKVFRKGI